MFQRRPNRASARSRSLALGGVVAALAVVGGGTVAVTNAPTSVDAGDILLAQNAAAQAAPQEMALGKAVRLDLEPVVARAAGGTIPAGTTVQVTGLPDGLSQDGWVISGTPSRAGDYDVLVTVSNAGVSKSQKVAITVTDEADGGATPAATPAATADPANSDSTTTDPSTTDPSTSDESDEPEATDEVAPMLSAVPGDQARAGAAGAAAGDLESDDDEVGTAPDLCSVLGDGQTDSSSVEKLLPALTGTDESASTGLLLVLVDAIVAMLPSVLGEGGVLEELGSAGELLCTLSPSLLGGQGDGADLGQGGTAGAGATAGAAADLLSGATPNGGGAALPVSPTALVGLLTSGAGSLGE